MYPHDDDQQGPSRPMSSSHTAHPHRQWQHVFELSLVVVPVQVLALLFEQRLTQHPFPFPPTEHRCCLLLHDLERLLRDLTRLWRDFLQH